MEQQLEKIRDVQKEAWNKSSAGWKKWDDKMMTFLRPMGDEMIRMLRLKESDTVLDVATGTGEPGLTMAPLVKQGRVTGTDLAIDMLAVAAGNAQMQGIRNFETVCCDVSELPFDDQAFDAVSCRLGLMFFPDLQIALQEMVRVLKPGGRLTVSVWDVAEKNSWITTSMQTMIEMLQLKLPSPGAPGLFRCSEKGFMHSLFEQVNLKNIESAEVQGKLCFDSPDTYWKFITEVACPVAFGKAEESLQLMIKEKVLGRVGQRSQTVTLRLNLPPSLFAVKNKLPIFPNRIRNLPGILYVVKKSKGKTYPGPGSDKRIIV